MWKGFLPSQVTRFPPWFEGTTLGLSINFALLFCTRTQGLATSAFSASWHTILRISKDVTGGRIFFWITNFGNTSFCLKWHPALGKGISWHVFFLCVFWLMDSACSSSPREQPQEGINTSSKGDHTGTSWDGYTTIHCRCTCCIGARFCLFYCWKWQLPPGCRGKAGIEYLTLGKCPPRKPIHTAF